MLDKDKKGFVNVEDISKLPEIEKNPLRFYICQNLANQDRNNDEINFELFLKLIDIFKNNKVHEQSKCIIIYINLYSCL